MLSAAPRALAVRCALFLCLAPHLSAASFDAQFETIKKTASKPQLYALLFDLPKGGDLHHHLGLSFMAEQWYAAATDPKRAHDEIYTRTRFNNCEDGAQPFLRFRNIRRATYLALSDCRKTEYEKLAALSPALKEQWMSSLKIDRPGEGRNEFFEAIPPRLTDLTRDPWLMTDLLVESLQRYGAQGLRYLETQTTLGAFTDENGRPMDPDRASQFYRDALHQPEAKASGVTVRFLATIIRYAPDAEQQLERAYAFVSGHRDLFVGVNMAGREDNDKGHPLRFLGTFRRLRRTYSGVQLSLHGGEKDSPGQDVRRTLTLGATRIGHAVNLISDPETMLLMRNGKYLIETSLVSNRLLEYTPDLSKHPFSEYLRFGIPVCLNTDDAGAWDSNITDEYFLAVTNFNLTWSEIVQIGRDSLQYSFAEEPVKARMLQEYAEAVARFERKYAGEGWAGKLAGVKPVYSGYAMRNFDLGAH
jgi:adenosine deaminase CECR1